MSDWKDAGLRTANQSLHDIDDQFDGLIEWAEENGYLAVAHKLQEAQGPLISAISATVQYDDGRLERR